MSFLAGSPTSLALTWEPHPDVWLTLGGLAVVYWGALRFWGPRYGPGGVGATTRQKACFAVGLAIMWLGADWPLHDVAEDHLYSTPLPTPTAEAPS